MAAINPATVEEHRKWALLLGLRFPLLADAGQRVSRAYGCKMPLLPVVRRTVYVIDKGGRVMFAERGMVSWDKVAAAITGR